MSSVEIEYCVPCGLLDRAVDVQRAVLEQYGQQIDGVELVTGGGGVFEVRAAGETVFDEENDVYDVDAIVDAVGDRVVATA